MRGSRGAKVRICVHCSRSFGRKEHLERHIRIRKQPWDTPKSSYSNRSLSDTKEKPFICSCGAKFARRDGLKSHASRMSHQDGFTSPSGPSEPTFKADSPPQARNCKIALENSETRQASGDESVYHSLIKLGVSVSPQNYEVGLLDSDLNSSPATVSDALPPSYIASPPIHEAKSLPEKIAAFPLHHPIPSARTTSNGHQGKFGAVQYQPRADATRLKIKSLTVSIPGRSATTTTLTSSI